MSDKPRLPSYEIHFQATRDELTQTIPYNITNYVINSLWDKIDQGEGVRIGVADTGVSEFHRTRGDLKGAVISHRDFTGSRSGTDDRSGHGTHTAGTIGARNNTQGIVGVLPLCELVIAKVLGDDGMGENRWVAEGVRYMVDSGCQIINLSLGSPAPDNSLLRAIEYGQQNNVLFVCAAGNDGASNSVNYPGRWSNTIAIGAVDKELQPAHFSSRGSQVDFCGPGVQILSCYTGSTYSSLSGTSMSSPWAAGVVGILQKLVEKHRIQHDMRSLTSVRSFMTKHAVDLGPKGRDNQFGEGVLNPNRMVNALLELATTEPPTTTLPPVTPPGDELDTCGSVLRLIESLLKPPVN